MAALTVLDPNKRSYQEVCPLARALDVVGERWTLLIVRNLLVGPMRYGELQDALPGVTTNLLAKRLKEMSARQLIEPRQTHGITVYALTERGRGLEAALLALSSWGESEPVPQGGHRNLRWAMLGLRRRYRGGVNGTLRIICHEPEREFFLIFDDAQLAFCEAIADDSDVTVEGTEAYLLATIYRRAEWRALLARGEIRLQGNRKLFVAMLRSTALGA